jgi:negative regulator of sigma E activity
MASSAAELTAVLTNPAPVEASWHVLCSYRSDFEGGRVAVSRPAAIVGQFEGAVDGEPVRGTVAVVVTSCPRTSQQRQEAITVLGVVQQWRGWLHRVDSDGDD